MKNLIDLYPVIEQGFPDEIDQHAIKLVLIAEEISQMEVRFVTHNDLEKFGLRLKIWVGSVMVIAVGGLISILKLL